MYIPWDVFNHSSNATLVESIEFKLESIKSKIESIEASTTQESIEASPTPEFKLESKLESKL